MLKLTVAHESWPIAGGFTISRGTKTAAEVVTVTLEDGNGAVGRGECVPYARYGETVQGVVEALEASRAAIEAGLERGELQEAAGEKASRAITLSDSPLHRSAGPTWYRGTATCNALANCPTV